MKRHSIMADGDSLRTDGDSLRTDGDSLSLVFLLPYCYLLLPDTHTQLYGYHEDTKNG